MSINLAQKLNQVTDYWSPHVIASFNGNDVRISKLEGEFVWHAHADSDEMFVVLEGTLDIHYRDRVETLNPGEIAVVPAGVDHKPVTRGEVHLLILNRAGESTTGTVEDSPFTRTDLTHL